MEIIAYRELLDLYFSLNILRVIKSWSMEWTGLWQVRGRKINARFSGGN
jgi:hypothetical protein